MAGRSNHHYHNHDDRSSNNNNNNATSNWQRDSNDNDHHHDHYDHARCGTHHNDKCLKRNHDNNFVVRCTTLNYNICCNNRWGRGFDFEQRRPSGVASHRHEFEYLSSAPIARSGLHRRSRWSKKTTSVTAHT